MGNPPLFPLVRETEAKDLIIIQINPFIRDEVPKRSSDINNRLNEIIFNSSVLHELRAAGIMLSILEERELQVDGLGEERLHRIEAEDVMQDLGVSSKMNAAPDFIDYLFEIGRSTADAWIAEHSDDLGVNTTWIPDIVQDYLDDEAVLGKAAEIKDKS